MPHPTHPRPIRRGFAASLLALGIALLAHPAAADDYLGSAGGGQKKNDFARPGGYLSLGVGGAHSMFRGQFEGANDFVSEALILGLRAGARFNKYLAFDASIDWSAKGFETNFTDGSRTELVSVTGFGNLKLYPFGGRIQPYAMGGVGLVWGGIDSYAPNGAFVGSIKEIAFAGRAGGGLDFYLTPHIALSGEVAYIIPTSVLADLDYLTYMGHVVFRF